MWLERSELAVPASNWHMIEKGVVSGADVIFLDLEDSVAPEAKAPARGNVIRALTELDWGTKPRVFRMNALDTPFFYRDLIEIVESTAGQIDFILLPKVNRPEDVYVVDTLLTQIEASCGASRPIGLELLIETAEGLINCERIATASPRVEALIFGPGDYTASLRIPSVSIGTPDEWDAAYPGHRFHYPLHRILVAGRAAGMRVIDGPFADFRDADGFRAACRVARALGTMARCAFTRRNWRSPTRSSRRTRRRSPGRRALSTNMKRQPAKDAARYRSITRWSMSPASRWRATRSMPRAPQD